MNDRPLRPLLGALVFSAACTLAFAATNPNSLAALRAQAEKGNAIAQYNLGLVYADPAEPAYDLVQAHVWLSRAEAQGSRSRDLERVAELLTPAQLRAAEAQIGDAPSVTITPLADEAPDLSITVAAPEPRQATIIRADPELRKRLAIAESALAVKERDLAKLREEVEAQTQREALNGSPNAVAEIEFLRSQLASSTSDVIALREELATVRSAQTTTQQSRETLAARLSQTETEIASLRSQATDLDSLQTDLTSTEAKLTANAQQLEAAQSQIQSLKEEIANSWKTQGHLQSQVAESQQAHDTARGELDTLKITREVQAQELANARAQTQQIQQTAATQAANLNAEIAQLRAQLASVPTLPSVDPTRIERVQTLESQLAASHQAHTAAQSEVAALSRARDAQTNDLANAQARLKELQLIDTEQTLSLGHITTLESQVAQSAQTQRQLQQALDHSQTQTRELTAELATNRVNLAKAKIESRPFIDPAELTLAREQLAATAQQRDELQAVIAARNGSERTQIAARETELSDLREQLSNQSGEAENLRQQVAAAAVETQVLQTAQTEIGRLRAELATAQESAAARIESSPTVTADTEANQEKLATTLRAFAAIEAQLRTTRQKLAGAERSTTTDAASIASLETQLAALQPTLVTAQFAAENAQTEASDVSTTLQETRLQLAASQAQLDRSSREFAVSQASNADQFRTAEFLAAKNADLSTQVRLTQEQYAEASRELADIRTRYALSVTNAVTATPNNRAIPSRPTPVLSDSVRTHTVTSGDSLSRIAKQYLGDEERWPEIVAANRASLNSANGVRIGMVLQIP
jgi:nucleoid-associated protein YgaU